MNFFTHVLKCNNANCEKLKRNKPAIDYLCDASSSKGHDHSHHVDGELELKEFWNAVIDVPPPHDCLDDAAEVVVGEYDVGGFFSHICASDALHIKKYQYKNNSSSKIHLLKKAYRKAFSKKAEYNFFVLIVK